MKLDVEEVLNRVLPWECELKIAGHWHKVRPPSLADMDALSKFHRNEKLSEIEAAGLIESLFEAPKPQLAEVDFPTFNLVAQAVTKYIGDYLSKKNLSKLLAAAGLEAEDKPNSTSSSLSSASAAAVHPLTPSEL